MRTPAREIVLDESGRLAGRGAYVCAGGDCLTIAITKGALGRALETPLPRAFLEDVAARGLITEDIGGGTRGKE